MKTISIQIPEEVHSRLKKLVKKKNYSMAGFLRFLVDQYLNQEKKENIELKKTELYFSNIMKVLLENRKLGRAIFENFGVDEKENSCKKIFIEAEKEHAVFENFLKQFEKNWPQ